MIVYRSYKEYVAAYIEHALFATGAKPDPVSSTIMRLVFQNASEVQCKQMYELTKNFINENTVEVSTEAPKLELKL